MQHLLELVRPLLKELYLCYMRLVTLYFQLGVLRLSVTVAFKTLAYTVMLQGKKCSPDNQIFVFLTG
jgi:hypothetical protein